MFDILNSSRLLPNLLPFLKLGPTKVFSASTTYEKQLRIEKMRLSHQALFVFLSLALFDQDVNDFGITVGSREAGPVLRMSRAITLGSCA